MKIKRYERDLLEVLLVLVGVPIERAHCDAAIIHFMLSGGKYEGSAPTPAETVSDARSEVLAVRRVQHAGTGMRTRLQRLLSFLHVTSRVS